MNFYDPPILAYASKFPAPSVFSLTFLGSGGLIDKSYAGIIVSFLISVPECARVRLGVNFEEC